MSNTTKNAAPTIEIQLEGFGYKYWVSKVGVMVALGWIRCDSAEAAMKIIRNLLHTIECAS